MSYSEKHYELERKFREVVKGKNFMTPRILEYIEIRTGVAELSEGYWTSNIKLYGVTVVQGQFLNQDLSKVFRTLEKAIDYIKTLQQ